MHQALLGDARSLLARGDHASGLTLCQRAIAAMQEDPATSDEDFALAFNLKGECQRFLGQLADALGTYDQAWQYARRIDDDAIKSMIASNRGIGYLSQGRVREAIASQKIALDLDLKHCDQQDIAFSRHNLGAALNEAGDHEGALSEIAQAIKIRYAIGDWDELLASLAFQANILIQLERYEEARTTAIQAIALEPNVANKTALRHPLIVLADSYSNEGNDEAALQPLIAAISIIEQMRARVSNQTAFDMQYYEYYARTIEVLFRTEDVGSALNLMDRTRGRAFNDHEAAGAPQDEEGFALRASIGTLLEPGEALIEMWLYRGSLKTMITDQSGFGFYTTPGVLGLDVDEALKDLVSHHELRTESGRIFNESFLSALRARKFDVRRAYLVPHGIQFQFPIACLRLKESGFLCEELEIAIVPSARAFRSLRARHRHPTRNCLIIGDPDGSLPYARVEAQMVAQALGCPALLGEDATAQRVLDLLRGGTFDVVHFACHYVSATSPELSGLLMADGITITARQISQSDFKANVVCNASCSSGLIPYSPSNDLAGFNGALLMGGSNAIISAIAPLHDKAASCFFMDFYNGYRGQGASVATAFAKSQRGLMRSREFAAPKYWAPLYLTGVS